MPGTGPSEPSSGRPKRNPHFSDTSHLIVLRDPKETKGGHDTSDADTASKQSHSRRHDWSSLPLGPGAWLDADTPPRPPRHMAFHDGIEQELAARSRLFAGKHVSRSPPIQEVPSITEPPSFFTENFPDALSKDHDEAADTNPPDAATAYDSEPPQEASITVHPPAQERKSSLASSSKPSPRLPDSSSLVSLMPLPPSPTPYSERPTQARTHAVPMQDSRQDECFATEVRIRGWQRIGSYARGWVAFDVVVTTKSVRVELTHRVLYSNRTNGIIHSWSSGSGWRTRRPSMPKPFPLCRLAIQVYGISTCRRSSRRGAGPCSGGWTIRCLIPGGERRAPIVTGYWKDEATESAAA